ncbi:integral membrane protein, YkoY family [Leptolyngbyaceae cyanobacterium JSC-12]|nr:integral membrane protein, YkoY family [Leptolyngbyaceae cyanobacterium JSC-12]
MIDQLLDFSPNVGLDTLLLLPVLVALEAVLSADNAIALAALTQGLHNPTLQRRALNIGLVLAYVLRMSLILTATWVINYWQVELAGALYLLWLVFQYFTSSSDDEGEHPHHGPRFNSLWQAIPMIAITDLAFSLDSVTTAIAVSKELWIILLGATIGIVTLRFMAGLFIHWLEEFTRLEDAGYITVALVGLRLLVRVVNEEFVPPEWLMVSAIALIFLWGFSKRKNFGEFEVASQKTFSQPSTVQAENEPIPSSIEVAEEPVESTK